MNLNNIWHHLHPTLTQAKSFLTLVFVVARWSQHAKKSSRYDRHSTGFVSILITMEAKNSLSLFRLRPLFSWRAFSLLRFNHPDDKHMELKSSSKHMFIYSTKHAVKQYFYFRSAFTKKPLSENSHRMLWHNCDSYFVCWQNTLSEKFDSLTRASCALYESFGLMIDLSFHMNN